MAKKRTRYVFDGDFLPIKNEKEADPNRIGSALEEIRESNAGRLTPEATVEAARNPRNALHPHFEWDDSVAAHRWRIETARTIIRLVRIVADDDGPSGPAFMSVRSDEGISYRSLGDVKKSRDLQLAVLQQAERDLEAFEQRYRELTEICDLVRQARVKLKARQARRNVDERVTA